MQVLPVDASSRPLFCSPSGRRAQAVWHNRQKVEAAGGNRCRCLVQETTKTRQTLGPDALLDAPWRRPRKSRFGFALPQRISRGDAREKIETGHPELKGQYHFSKHFTADLLSYNSADYVVSSSLREICGTEDEQGMIEAHELFSMPGLYRVQSGLNPRLARHNIIPPVSAKSSSSRLTTLGVCLKVPRRSVNASSGRHPPRAGTTLRNAASAKWPSNRWAHFCPFPE